MQRANTKHNNTEPSLLHEYEREFKEDLFNQTHQTTTFHMRWQDAESCTPAEVAFARNALVEQILCPHKKTKLVIYDVFTGAGSDFESFLEMNHLGFLYGNTTEKDFQYPLKENLANFTNKIHRRKHGWNGYTLADLPTIQPTAEGVKYAHTRIFHPIIDFLYLDPPWKLYKLFPDDNTKPKRAATPQEIIDFSIEYILNPLRERNIQCNLIVFKGKWSCEEMRQLCHDKLPSYNHILTLNTVPFAHEFQFHFLTLTPPATPNTQTVNLELVNSQAFDQIYGIPRKGKPNVIPPQPGKQYKLQVRMQNNRNQVVPFKYNIEKSFEQACKDIQETLKKQ